MNLIDVELLINNFITSNHAGISTVHYVHFKNKNESDIAALLLELRDELKNGCITYINKYDIYDEKELNSYLFYIVNDFCKKKKQIDFSIKRKIQYVCPACLYLGNENMITSNHILICNVCQNQVKSSDDPKKIFLYKIFATHNKQGYRCGDCKRFVPHPLDGSKIISCPYFDCCFVGDIDSLKKMNHPTATHNMENLIPAKIISDSSHKLEINNDVDNKVKILQEVISSQIGNISYNSSNFTIKHKTLTYQAISNILYKYPQEMTQYLIEGSRKGGFQHKIFQEYISLLEKSLPFSFKKNNKIYKIESLLDEQLCLFDGISEFEAKIPDSLEVKNNTQETYIGGRKATYVKPFFIGKIISIIDKNSGKSLMQNIEEYSFSKIKLQNVLAGTTVIVKHLRVPPHYQMGGMVYVNRLRKKIVDKALFIINKENNE